MREAVKVPEGEDENEWLATHVVDAYNEISLLFGVVEDYATPERFPTMRAGSRYEYLWADDKHKKPRQVPAQEYVDLLLMWVEGLISNEEVFPVDADVPFPPNFRSICSKIFARMFRVYAFLYYHCFDEFVALKAEAHLNTCFKHFLFFVKEFELVSDDEMAPLAELIAGFEARAD